MKKVIGIVMVVMMLLGLMIPVMASADTKTQDYMWVNCADGKKVNIRQSETTKSTVLYRVESGKKIEIVDSAAPGWLYVRQGNKACGYVMAKYLVASKPGKYEITEREDNFRNVANYTVTAQPLNGKTEKSVCLRVKPNKTGKSIRRLAAGDTLTVVAVGKTWSKVVDTATGRTGYVANDYISKV